jgi:threonine dehydrogenase-like Zn-dependent dehydrogenase
LSVGRRGKAALERAHERKETDMAEYVVVPYADWNLLKFPDKEQAAGL